MTLRITFQGERGAYSESAAINFFGKNAQTISCPTFSNALDLIEREYGSYCTNHYVSSGCATGWSLARFMLTI